MIESEFVSDLNATPEQVWQSVVSPEGINYEMAPLIKMTFPSSIKALDEIEIVQGQKLFRSWLLLFGIVPVGFTDLALAELKPGKGFLERSSMSAMRFWEHHRSISVSTDGTRLADRLRFEPLFLKSVTGLIVRYFFNHRHKKLRKKFGG